MNRPIWTVVATAVMALAMGAAPAVAETPSPDAPSAPVTSGSIDPSLYGAAAEKGTVRVNVVTEERSDLSGASSAGRTMQKFQKLPLVTLQVTRSGLDALAAKPGVVSVTEDTLSEPTLDTSMPFIGGDRAIKTGKTGKGSAIAVIDTGVATKHPFLQGRVVSEACFSPIDPAYSATSLCPQGTAAEEGPGTADSEVGPCATITECEHGTHVAGIAVGDGTGIVSAPVSGVAPDADVIAIQVFSRLDSPDYCGEGNTPCVKSFTSAQVAALEKVLQLRQAGIPVITANLSLGGGQYSSPCGSDVRKPMIDALLEAGSPPSSPQATTVSATGSTVPPVSTAPSRSAPRAMTTRSRNSPTAVPCSTCSHRVTRSSLRYATVPTGPRAAPPCPRPTWPALSPSCVRPIPPSPSPNSSSCSSRPASRSSTGA